MNEGPRSWSTRRMRSAVLTRFFSSSPFASSSEAISISALPSGGGGGSLGVPLRGFRPKPARATISPKPCFTRTLVISRRRPRSRTAETTEITPALYHPRRDIYAALPEKIPSEKAAKIVLAHLGIHAIGGASFGGSHVDPLLL